MLKMMPIFCVALILGLVPYLAIVTLLVAKDLECLIQ